MVLIISITSINIFKSKNPIKVCLKLILYIKSFCLLISFIVLTTFYPLIMVIVIVGGLLIMYIIMSRILPNNPIKTNKIIKVEKIYIFIMIAVTSIYMASRERIIDFQQIYTIIIVSQNRSFYMTIFILVLYFYCITVYIESEDTSLRSYI